MTEQPEHFVIRELEQIRALSDPLRQQILSALIEQPRTTKQVALLLGQPLTKLYRHVEILEQAGLITLVQTVPKRGATEKYFQAVARSFSVAGNSLSPELTGEVEEMFAKAFEDVLKEVRTGVRAERRQSQEGVYKGFLAVGEVQLTPERLQEFQERLTCLTEEFGCSEGDAKPNYKLLIALCPKIDPANPE